MNPKSNRPKGIKPSLFAVLLLCAAVVETGAQPSAGGIVYGPKGAFNISAPKGWVLDPSAGAEQGLPCVLYPKGASWESADPLMYAKIASTDYEDYEAFAAIAIKEMRKQRGELKVKRVESAKLRAASVISSTSIRRGNRIGATSVLPTFNCPRPSPL